jgi:hypothetical protein
VQTFSTSSPNCKADSLPVNSWSPTLTEKPADSATSRVLSKHGGLGFWSLNFESERFATLGTEARATVRTRRFYTTCCVSGSRSTTPASYSDTCPSTSAWRGGVRNPASTSILRCTTTTQWTTGSRSHTHKDANTHTHTHTHTGQRRGNGLGGVDCWTIYRHPPADGEQLAQPLRCADVPSGDPYRDLRYARGGRRLSAGGEGKMSIDARWLTGSTYRVLGLLLALVFCHSQGHLHGLRYSVEQQIMHEQGQLTGSTSITGR